ncbi:MAG: EFR1 family ferrodoxin [Breznakibacter sp.]
MNRAITQRPERIVVFYFSGTGNAKQVALWLCELAVQRGIGCQLCDIARTDIDTMEIPGHGGLIVFISPIHGFNYPKITLDFIRRFPKGRNNVVLMNTRAGMRLGRIVTPGLTGVAFILSSMILKGKGYGIVGQIPFDMPSNWISIHPALGRETVAYLQKTNYGRVEKHANKILEGKADFIAYRDLLQDILISPVSLAYYLVGRFAFAKSFYASGDCDVCGLCVKQCPVKAIKVTSGRPYWTFKCESCMKCMNSCSKKAIETAHGLFLASSVLGAALTTVLLNKIMGVYIENGFVRSMVFSLVFMALLWILYDFQHLLLRNKYIGKLISLTSLTHYKFWGRYKLTLHDGRKK